MTSITEYALINIVPPNFQDDIEVQCFCYAVDKQIKKIIEASEKIHIWGNDANWDKSMCDYLAVELRTPFYEEKSSIESKRELVKKTLEWYSKLGTKAVVKEIVSAVLGYAEILEWYEDGSEPYTFRLETTDVNLTGEMAEEFKHKLGQIKNVRSKFNGIDFVIPLVQSSYAAFTLMTANEQYLKIEAR